MTSSVLLNPYRFAAAPPATANTLRLPAVNGNYASTPDSAAVSLTGDLDLRAKVILDDWTPGGERTFLAKWGEGTSRTFNFSTNTANQLQLQWTADGTWGNKITVTSSTALVVTDGTVKWVRVTLDLDTGSGQYAVDFYTSDDGTAWTQLGTTRTGATLALFDGTDPVTIGGRQGTGTAWLGNVYYVEMRSGIGGSVVASFDATAVTVLGTRNPTTYVAPTGETWTVGGGAWDWVTV